MFSAADKRGLTSSRYLGTPPPVRHEGRRPLVEQRLHLLQDGITTKKRGLFHICMTISRHFRLRQRKTPTNFTFLSLGGHIRCVRIVFKAMRGNLCKVNGGIRPRLFGIDFAL